MQNVEVDYFPTRDSITFAADDKRFQIDNFSGYQVIDTCDKYLLAYDQTNYAVADILNNTWSSHTGGFMIALNNNGSGFTVISDATKPYYKKDNRAYYSVWDSGQSKLTIYKLNGQVYKIINVRQGGWADNQIETEKINALSDSGIYYIHENISLRYWDFETQNYTTITDELISNKVYCFNNVIYYETQDGIWANDELLISSDNYTTFNGVMKVDLKTGYGILVDNEIIKSAFTDTELDYPNNFYFNYLAYKLAVYYLIKQHQDYTGLVALANDALKTFYDTLPKDENEYVRISNVYAR